MERTMSFNEWVTEYKPVEFNEDILHLLDTEEALIHLDAANLIGKYLIKESECLGKFPSSHIWTPTYNSRRVVSLQYMSSLGGCPAAMVTRKPRIDRRDKIIIDLPGEYNYSIVLFDYFYRNEIDFYEDF